MQALVLAAAAAVKILPTRVCAAAHPTGVCLQCLVLDTRVIQERKYSPTVQKQHLSFLGVFISFNSS